MIRPSAERWLCAQAARTNCGGHRRRTHNSKGSGQSRTVTSGGIYVSRGGLATDPGCSVVLISVGPRVAAAEEHAQTAPANALEEVLVTAQKRAEDITSVPISISSVSQDTLDQQGAKNIADLARLVPGVNAQPATAGEMNVSIRGISTTVGAATTGVYIDDTPVQARYICFYCGFTAYPQLFDLERVEVLRGPQGTLFGSGSEGGTIRFITPAPSLTRYSLYSRSEVGFKDDGAPNWEMGVAGGGPLVEGKAGFRASLWTRTDGGYIDHVAYPTGALLDKDANSAKDYVARIAFLLAPVEALQITPSFFYQRTHHDSRDSWWEGADCSKHTPGFQILLPIGRDSPRSM